MSLNIGLLTSWPIRLQRTMVLNWGPSFRELSVCAENHPPTGSTIAATEVGHQEWGTLRLLPGIKYPGSCVNTIGHTIPHQGTSGLAHQIADSARKVGRPRRELL